MEDTPQSTPGKSKKQKKTKGAESSSSSTRSNLKPISKNKSNNSLLGLPTPDEYEDTPGE